MGFDGQTVDRDTDGAKEGVPEVGTIPSVDLTGKVMGTTLRVVS